ncbi:MAG TPA: hypothetical protein VFK94_03105 [Patescibacteria group bacterium]|nr:hypothetical protein [Patescibacteria group bacterium]
MATLTSLLGLRKPAPSDNVNVTTDISDNMQAIDDYFAGRFAVTPGRNVIRNGDMGVAQRGGGAVNTTQARTVDGWLMVFSGGGCQHIRSALTVGSSITDALYTLKTDITGQSAAGDFFQTVHRIEGVRTYAGKQVTLSFIARTSVGTPKIGVEIEQSFGTGGAPSAIVTTAISAITISTTLTKYSLTFTVPSISGKILGTNNDDYLAINLWMSAGATYAARASNIGIQNVTALEITDVQLEAGSVATAFERLPQQVQLAWCQRYFWRSTSDAVNQPWGWGTVSAAGTGFVGVPLPVPMRAYPTFTSSGSINFSDRLSNFAVTALTLQASTALSPTFVDLAVTTAGGMTAGRASVLYSGAAGVYIQFSAEL